MMLAAFPAMSFKSVYTEDDDAPRFLNEMAALGVRPSADPRWRIIKTHEWQDGAVPDKIIWLVRDGRDASASYWHYRKRTDPSLTDPIAFWESLKGEKTHGFDARWDRYIEGIQEKLTNRSHLRIHYEDALMNPKIVLSVIGEYLGEGTVLGGVERVSFDQLHEMNASFYRKGRVGSYHDDLKHDAIEYLERELRTNLRALGYMRDPLLLGHGEGI